MHRRLLSGLTMEEDQPQEWLTRGLARQLYDGLDDLVNGARQQLNRPEPEADRVYHYTTLPALIAMSGSGPHGLPWSSIWASSMAYMNDKQEFHHGHAVMQAAWSGALHQEESDLVRGILEASRCAMSTEDLHWYAMDVYVASFSMLGDQLGQWRGYADFGKGISIGFNLDRLRRNVQAVSHWVVYEQDLQEVIAKTLVNRIQEDLRLLVNEANAERVKEEVLEWMPSLMSLMYARLKHPAFAEEAEFRVCVAGVLGPLFSTRKFRPRGPALIPYLELTFYDHDRGIGSAPMPIEEVILGPAASWETNQASLQMFFDLNRHRLMEEGERVEVKRSMVPLT